MERVPKRFREHARRAFAGEAAALVLTADNFASQIAGSKVKQHRAVAELLVQQHADQVVVAAKRALPPAGANGYGRTSRPGGLA